MRPVPVRYPQATSTITPVSAPPTYAVNEVDRADRAGNTINPVEHTEYIDDPSSWVRSELAANTTISHATAATLARDDHHDVTETLAEHCRYPDILTTLAATNDDDILYELAGNTHTPSDVLVTLASHHDHEISDRAANHLHQRLHAHAGTYTGTRAEHARLLIDAGLNATEHGLDTVLDHLTT